MKGRGKEGLRASESPFKALAEKPRRCAACTMPARFVPCLSVPAASRIEAMLFLTPKCEAAMARQAAPQSGSSSWAI